MEREIINPIWTGRDRGARAGNVFAIAELLAAGRGATCTVAAAHMSDESHNDAEVPDGCA